MRRFKNRVHLRDRGRVRYIRGTRELRSMIRKKKREQIDKGTEDDK